MYGTSYEAKTLFSLSFKGIDTDVCLDLHRLRQALSALAARLSIAKKSISDVTLARWGAGDAEDAEDADKEEDHISDIKFETPDIMYRY